MISGIYEIKNEVNGKRYIGQASNLPRRIKDHKSKLRVNKHHNSHLQASWNKYTEKIFTFEVLEYCELQYLTIKEQEWIDKFPSTLLYNIGAVETPMLGKRHSEEALNKMRVPKSEEHKQKISNALKGKKHSATHSKRSGRAKKKAVVMVSTGIEFESISQAALFMGVHRFNLGAHLAGKYKTCKGEVFKFKNSLTMSK